MPRPDLFSSLIKWANRQGENFTTDAFVYLVNELVQREPDAAIRFLGWLCFDDENCSAFTGSLPLLVTQKRSEEGTPDIVVDVPGCFVLIEVKTASDLHPGQLEQYWRLLQRQPACTKRLVLLTAQPVTVGTAPPDLWRRWSDVENRLDRQAFVDPIASFLVRQFLQFLRRQVMAVERIEWQYLEGVKSLHRFTTMLAKALEAANIPIYKASATWDSRGYYTQGKQFWTGIYMDSPEILRFQFDAASPNAGKLKTVGWEVSSGAWTTTLDLASEEAHFFSRTKEGQLKMLAEFLSSAHATALDSVNRGSADTEGK